MTARARLWLRHPRDDAERHWRDHLAPMLARRGLDAGEPSERSLPDDTWARVFPVASPAAIVDLDDALRRDPDWVRTLASLGLSDDGARPTWALQLESVDTVTEGSVVAGGTRSDAWFNFDAQDGLPSVFINHIVDDGEAGLYLSVHEGLCRFDGATVTMYRDPTGTVGRLQGLAAEADTGCVWSVDETGRLLSWSSGRFSVYGVADGLGFDVATFLRCDGQGRIWVAGPLGSAACITGKTFTALDLGVPAGDRLLDMTADGDGWLLATTAGLYRHDGGGTRRIGLADEAVHAVCVGADGAVWAGAEGGVYRFDEEGGQRQAAFDDLGRVVGFMRDARGTLWARTQQSGLGRWDGRRLTRYGTGRGLLSNQPRGLHEDRRGFVWVSTWGSGLSRFDGHCIRGLGEEQGLPACRVETLCEDGEGRVWLGTWGAGVLCVDGERARPAPGLEGCGQRLWSSLVDRSGRLWFGTYEHGACCWDGGEAVFFGTADGLGHPSVLGMLEDRQGRMWFATQGGGLTCRDGDHVRTYTTVDGLGHDFVWAVAEDAQGHIWCSTYGTGVCRFDGERFARFTVDEGLAHNQVWCLHLAADGDLWMGTWGGGVSRWDGTTFTNYSTGDGLTNNNVRTIGQSRDGHLWFGTFGGGVSRYDGRVFQTFSRREGLVHDAVQAVLQAADGGVWIGTEEGVTCYRPPTDPPRIRIGGIVADRRYEARPEVVLSTAQRVINLEFSGASYTTTRDRLVYAWRLRGHDETWQTTTRRRAEVRDLPRGAYTFEVCAVDRDLNASAVAHVRLLVEADTDQDRLQALRAELAASPGLDQFLGHSPALSRVLNEVDTVAAADVTVLILGETGTGKGLAARAIHSLSERRAGPFIQVNCGAIPEGLVESELFGHERGAFTGAVARRIGRFELAEGGTLFLDEIGDLPPESQQVLLHVLQEGLFQRVGGRDSIRARVRVVAATNRDLLAAARAGEFREDLYYRLSAFVLHLPPLRERRQDVLLLWEYFVETFARHLSRPVPQTTARTMEVLCRYDWPGNVRELEHLAQRAVLVCSDGVVREEDLGLAEPAAPGLASAASGLDDLDASLAEQERAFVMAALEASNWVIYGDRGAARRLGVHPEKLRRRMRKLGLRRP